MIESTRDVAARVVLSHPGTGPFVQQAARALYEANLLSAYVTTFHYDRDSMLGRSLRAVMGAIRPDAEKQLSRRLVTEIPLELIRAHPLPEMIRMAGMQTNPITADRIWERTEKWFDRMVARRHLEGTDAVYGYEFACLATFEAQKARGGLCLYDMPICHYATTSRWLDAEYEKYPELVTAYDKHRTRRAGPREARKDAELALADCVIVASKFVRDSVVAAGVDPERIVEMPSGAPPVHTESRSPDSKKFVFIAAGHLSLRKGTHYLLDAWRMLAANTANAELWLIGNWQLPERLRLDLPSNVVHIPTVPREELYARFDRANALVFPTLAEGLALTPLQAMARGLPVITTRNSGCESFIRTSENGWLVPPCDPVGLAAAMQDAMARPSDTEAIGREAAATMARWQWSDYRAALGHTLTEYLTPGHAHSRTACASS